MPRDAQIGRTLAAAINANTFSLPQTTEFRYDQFVEGDRVDDLRIRISTETQPRNRDSKKGRTAWSRNCGISVICLAPQQANTTVDVDAEAEIDALLDFWDEVLDFIETQTPEGNSLVDQDELDGARFDQTKLQDDRQFRTGVLLEYRLI